MGVFVTWTLILRIFGMVSITEKFIVDWENGMQRGKCA